MMENTLKTEDYEFNLFRDYIENHCGIYMKHEKKYLLETRLASLVDDSKCKSFSEFYFKLKNESMYSDLLHQVVDALTTNETLWFRDIKPFEILDEIVFPEMKDKLISKKKDKINIWSAACSTGQEPYSIAVTALNYFQKKTGRSIFPEYVKILATDISNSILCSAIEGKYNTLSINRGLPQHILETFFKKKGEDWHILPEVKNMIKFKQLNLKVPFSGTIGTFDIVFLRNVIIYFSDPFKKVLFERISRNMNPGGYLFLGTGESVGGYTEAFEMLRYKDFLYYRLK